MRLNMKSNLGLVQGRLNQLATQVPFAVAVALTKTAKDVQSSVKQEMKDVFDRPVAYTLNSVFVKAATKQSLEARVWLKDNPFGKGTPADRYLAPQIFGGSREQKGMEKALQAAGLMADGDYAVPAAGAQLDANGNVRRSQIVQILSQLKVQRKAGFESRASGSAASKRAVARQGVTYFALPTAIRGLKPGIYLKRKFAHGTAIRPVFIFVPKVQYKIRLRFFAVGEQTYSQRFSKHLDDEVAREVQRALARR
jgi:hypothetical protein